MEKEYIVKRGMISIRYVSCESCGVEFKTNHSRKITCSKDCSENHRAKLRKYRNYKGHTDKKRECLNCGITFITRANFMVCCSKDCSKKHRHKYMNERNERLKDSERTIKSSCKSGFIRKYGFNPDDELIEIKFIKRLLHRAIKKAGD